MSYGLVPRDFFEAPCSIRLEPLAPRAGVRDPKRGLRGLTESDLQLRGVSGSEP